MHANVRTIDSDLDGRAALVPRGDAITTNVCAGVHDFAALAPSAAIARTSPPGTLQWRRPKTELRARSHVNRIYETRARTLRTVTGRAHVEVRGG